VITCQPVEKPKMKAEKNIAGIATRSTAPTMAHVTNTPKQHSQENKLRVPGKYKLADVVLCSAPCVEMKIVLKDFKYKTLHRSCGFFYGIKGKIMYSVF